MKLSELLHELQSLGIDMHADNGILRVNAGRGQLTPLLKEAIASHKVELMTYLASQDVNQRGGIPAVSRDEPLPLSFFQERMWVLNRLQPESCAFNIVSTLLIEQIDVDSLKSVVLEVVARHEILRAVFRGHDGVPSISVRPAESAMVEIHNFIDLAPEQQLVALRTANTAASMRVFDLAMEVPARFQIYRLSADRVVLLASLHHIAVDAWSVSLLFREIVAASRAAEARIPTPPAILQYADYAAWQRAAIKSPEIAGELKWWEERLHGIPQLSAFPADRINNDAPAGRTHTVSWNAGLSKLIRNVARDLNATLYMAMLAACGAVLRAHTAQEDMVFGSPMGTRERPQLESIIGPFVNLLLVRLDLSGNPTFAQLLRRCRDAVLDAHAHRQVPFEMLLERLKPERSLDHSPLFQVALLHHNAPGNDAVPTNGGGAMHEITWFVREVDGQIENSFEYRSDLYSTAMIERIARHLELFLSHAVAAPETRIADIEMFDDGERAKLVGEFNRTALDISGATMTGMFERQVATDGAATAVRFGDVALSYDELNARSNRLAHRLRASGMAPGRMAGICLHRSLEMVVALLAVQKTGGCYVPLDPGFPAERLRFMIGDCGASILIAVEDALAGVDLPANVWVVHPTGDDAGEASTLTAVATSHDPAYVIYTSGSTGRPKGVSISHGSLANFLVAMQRAPGLSRRDVLAAVTTVSFDIAALELYLPLTLGACIELIARETAADGSALAARLKESGATVLQATPATWRLLLETEWTPPPGFKALCGGETLPFELAQELLAKGTELWNMYGPTETTIWSTMDRVTAGSAPMSIGKPIANTQVYVIDSNGKLAPIGIAGELCIGGSGVAIGYHRRDQLTAERFVSDPYSLSSGARMYRTGDLARWLPDGRLEHLGRLDQQVKIRGFRIELGEIEAVLATHSAVRQCAVLARDAAPGDTRLIAYVVYQQGEDLTVSDVRRHLRRDLPEYMIPSVVLAVDSLPLTPNGKLDRSALPNPFRTALQAACHEPPKPGFEQTLAEIWKAVLQIDRVGAGDNFFELGGHSLLSIRVANEVEKRVRWKMDPRTLFFQTLRQVAEAAENHVRDGRTLQRS